MAPNTAWANSRSRPCALTGKPDKTAGDIVRLYETEGATIFPRSLRGRLHLETIMGAADDGAMKIGIGTARDLTWKDGLDAFTCTECGRIFEIRDGIPVLLLDEARVPEGDG